MAFDIPNTKLPFNWVVNLWHDPKNSFVIYDFPNEGEFWAFMPDMENHNWLGIK